MMDIGVKYLDYLQAAITRMAANGFTAKGWSITLTTALLGIAVKDGNNQFALVGLVPVLLFWSLDAYFLALERRFRGLFGKAAEAVVADTPVSPQMAAGKIGPADIAATAVRPAVLLIHGTLAATLLIVFLLLQMGGSGAS
jgi:hypothetical protein